MQVRRGRLHPHLDQLQVGEGFCKSKMTESKGAGKRGAGVLEGDTLQLGVSEQHACADGGTAAEVKELQRQLQDYRLKLLGAEDQHMKKLLDAEAAVDAHYSSLEWELDRVSQERDNLVRYIQSHALQCCLPPVHTSSMPALLIAKRYVQRAQHA